MNKLRIIFLIILLAECVFGTIRYVSKTGSSTPPFTSWETASDSIQKCINICVDGDTVIVANGVYKESLIINAAITFIGSSMDSCVIDGRGLSPGTIKVLRECSIEGFSIIGKEQANYTRGILDGNFNISIDISDCKISNCDEAIAIASQSGIIKSIIVTNVNSGIRTFCILDTCRPKLLNSVLIINKQGESAWLSYDGGQPTITNNIIVTEGNYATSNSAAAGIKYTYNAHKNIVIRNNLISGFNFSTVGTVSDTAKVINNVFSEKQRSNATSYSTLWGVSNEDKVYNNIFMKNYNTINAVTQPTADYNLFWKNDENINPPYYLGSNDIIADPMLVKDTLGYTLKGDKEIPLKEFRGESSEGSFRLLV